MGGGGGGGRDEVRERQRGGETNGWLIVSLRPQNRRFIRAYGREPRTATSTLPQLLSSDREKDDGDDVEHHVLGCWLTYYGQQ